MTQKLSYENPRDRLPPRQPCFGCLSLILLLVPLVVVLPYTFGDSSFSEAPLKLQGWLGDLILFGIPAATFILGGIGICLDETKRWAWIGTLMSSAFVVLFGYLGIFWFFRFWSSFARWESW